MEVRKIALRAEESLFITLKEIAYCLAPSLTKCYTICKKKALEDWFDFLKSPTRERKKTPNDALWSLEDLNTCESWNGDLAKGEKGILKQFSSSSLWSSGHGNMRANYPCLLSKHIWKKHPRKGGPQFQFWMARLKERNAALWEKHLVRDLWIQSEIFDHEKVWQVATPWHYT